jgi:ATP-dependent Lon protease
MREVIDLALLNDHVDDALDLTVKEDKKPVLN